jgi:cation:H+ antiporter
VSPLAAVPLFLASLTVTLLAARLFARRLDRLGIRFGFPEALIGLLTALAADGPEIASALFALVKGAHSASVGVLVGSNAFNLAAMIGISGLVDGSVRLARESLLLEGLFGAAITLIAIVVLLRWVAAPVAAVAAACVLAPYLLMVIGGSELLLHKPLARRIADPLARALAGRPQRPQPQSPPTNPTHHLLALIVLDVALILAGSAGMVQAALSLGDRWHISQAALGVLILAPPTSIPNAITGVRLGIAGRSAALVGETFKSNTINLAAGVIIPALFTAFAALSATAKLQLGWLAAMTLFSLLALSRSRGMGRAHALVLIVVYLGFAATQLLSG